jgi:hypothetical protein
MPRRTLSSTRFRCSSVTSGPRCSAPVRAEPETAGQGGGLLEELRRECPADVEARVRHADLEPAEYCVRIGRSCGCHSSAKLVTWIVSVGRGAVGVPELSLFRFREAIPERVQRMRTTRSWCETTGQARRPDEFSAPTPSRRHRDPSHSTEMVYAESTRTRMRARDAYSVGAPMTWGPPSRSA